MNAKACRHTDAPKYVRHQPEKTLLYKVLTRYLEPWLARRSAESSSPLPDFVVKALRIFLICGILEYGFTLVTCEKCQTSFPVPHSCKDRSFCPSCAAKRASETTTHLIDNVLPHVPYRQYVVTFPHALRFWLATSRELTNKVHMLVAKMIGSYYETMAEERGIKDGAYGGLTFIQRFGSALNLNVHFHTIVADGVWARKDKKPVFHQLPGPRDEHVVDIVEAVAAAVIDLLRSRGYLPEKGETVDHPDLPPPIDEVFAGSDQLTAALAASHRLRIAFDENAGSRVRRIGSGFGYQEEIGLVKGRRLASANGFTIHADRLVGAGDRRQLENLISYAARGPFSHKRLALKDPANPDGDLVYTLKTPWRDGTEAVVFTPDELIEKLAALVPPRYLHLSRAFGVFAPNSAIRPHIILRPHVKKGYVAVEGSESDVEKMSWSKLLKRTFQVDIERCQACGAHIRPENCTAFTEPDVIQKVLALLAIEYHPPPIHTSGQMGLELVYEEAEWGD